MTKGKPKTRWARGILLVAAAVLCTVCIAGLCRTAIRTREPEGPAYQRGAVEMWAPDGQFENHLKCIYQWHETNAGEWTLYVPSGSMLFEYRDGELDLCGERKYTGPVTVILFDNDVIIEQYGTGGHSVVYHEEQGPEHIRTERV